MKKSIKSKILTAAIMPLGMGMLMPITLLSSSCDNKELNKTKKELEETKKQLDQTKKDLNKTKQELKDITKEDKNLIDPEPRNDDSANITKEECDFENTNREYTINPGKINAYFVDSKKENPLVDLDEVLKVLEGYVDNGSFKVIVDEVNNQKIYQILEGDKVVEQLIYNWAKNYIHVTNTSFFYNILKPQQLTDNSQFLKIEYEGKKEDNKGVTFNLAKYDMDILYHKGKLLIPFSIFNTLYMSQAFTNMYFNGKKFVNVFAGMDSYGETDKDTRKKIRDNELVGKSQSKELRQATYNHFLFTMDYFYGLKGYKKIDSFDNYISKKNKEKFLSTNAEDYNEAYVNIFHKQLNELHTRMNSLSYYESDWSKPRLGALKIKDTQGEYLKKFYANRKMLRESFEKRFGEISKFQPKDYIRYHNKTAIVNVFEFVDGEKDQIQGEDAWKYDTYYLMRKLMDEVKQKTEIKNIILDISLNGGGSVNAMVRALGFMTDDPILNREYDVLNRRADLTKSRVDTDGDGNYDNDAYKQYNWNLLVSLNTFSAANQLTSIVKEMKIAKIIGQRTGGGMSAIMPFTLMDGTTVTISSPNNAVFGENNSEIESGIEPDLKIDYKDFYNDEALDKALNKANNN
ncbi:peptidase S41 [Metamycoplasma equirhinis]|uniref:S41 family peptidase n=1 Tax=Metamycoplasma equirhinis TaxID=92402 RepID=UPI0025733813|nr:S41 family peptidase [Metamycoplasma equirhinis]BDX52633.1 peptidase S41 [Metamycoplasma equirhinis]